METSLNRCLEATGANFGRASARFGPWAGAEERAEEEAAAPVYRSAKPPSSDMPRLTRGFSVHVPWLGRISGGTSAQKRLQTLAVFSFSLYGLLPLIAISWFVVLLCLINPLTLPFILGYLYFVFVADKAPTAGSRAPFLRQLTTWWHAYCDYFPMLLVKTAEYVLGYHPHGIISVGAFGAFATDGARTLSLVASGAQPREGRGFSSLFPGIERRLVTLPINFTVPFGREYILSMGACTSDKATFRSVLGRGSGSAVVVVVGGAEESTMVTPGQIDLVLERRKGFVREAIMAGASLVPVLAFGENDLYAVFHTDDTHPIARLQRVVRRHFGVALPLFRGRSMFITEFGLMPNRKPIAIVVGGPLAPPPLDDARRAAFRPKWGPDDAPSNDDARMVDAMHTEYVDALSALYEAHKEQPWNLAGINRQGTFRVLK
ncbi:hypothetical protein EMIHUDRAFT_213149 [Emiliania huxleyi CCMP1516]|uniref:Acyltransferase n=4 Tax=Emiliania huxleyi TaxID=2903 RepID=A0A0D3INS5_EMIH1|nr:hypothetical protein EMIHUDRAFT_213149 [Emiliania huxleyi CCMP1516]EOD12910.1 hypothetical protein EMIHUDRAFT_213149 [Emiliania huxleyi CCMP1516]|eukprot:XP_005765339.1 hypothetical protein EMIHUDRAFT_213149 [Emiliania huxleyi CCMP1516]